MLLHHRAVAVAVCAALLAPFAVTAGPAGVARAQQQTGPVIPDGATQVASGPIVRWNEELFQAYREKARTITGTRDKDGRLIGPNGDILSDTLQGALLMARDAHVLDLQGFATSLVEEQESPREEKVQLGKDLEVKAQEAREAKVAMDNAKAGFDSFLPDEIRYANLVDRQKRLAAEEDWDGVTEVQLQIEGNYYYQYLQARQRFVSLLDATPLLVVEVDDVPLYEAFADPSLFPPAASGMSPAVSDQRYVDLVNTYLAGGIAQTNEQIVIFSTMTDLPGLSQLASPRFANVQNRLMLLGQSVNSEYLVLSMSELQWAANHSLKDFSAEAWDKTIDQGLIVVAVGSIFLPGGAVIAAAVSEVQVARAAGDLIISYQDANQARALAPVTGYGQVLLTQEQIAANQRNLFITVGGAALDGFGVYRWARIVSADEAARAQQAAMAAARDATSAPGNLPPGVSRADTIVDDASSVSGSGTFGPARPGDTATFNRVLDPNAPTGTAAFSQVLRPDNLPPGAASPNAEIYLFSDLRNMASPNYVPAQILRQEKADALGIWVRARNPVGGGVDGPMHLQPEDFALLQERGGLSYIDGLANRGFIPDDVQAGSLLVDGVRPNFIPLLDEPTRHELRRFYLDYMARNNMALQEDLTLSQILQGTRPATAPGAAADAAQAATPNAATAGPSGSLLPLGTVSEPAARAGDPVRVTREGVRILQALGDDGAGPGTTSSTGAAGTGYLPTEYFELFPYQNTRDEPRTTPPVTPPEYGYLVPSGGLDASPGTGFDSSFGYSFDPGAGISTGSQVAYLAESTWGRHEIRLNSDVLSNADASSAVQNIEIVPRNDGATAQQSGRTRSQPPTLAALVATPFRHILSALVAQPLAFMARSAASASARFVLRAAQQPPQAAGLPTPSAKIFLTALGGSAGKVMQMVIVNDGDVPVNLVSDGFVAEPVARVTKAQIDREIGRLKNFRSVTATVDAYCLDMAKLPPTAGMVFRVAAPALQQRYEAVRSVLNATRQLWDAGRLTGGAGDPTYEHGVRQWVIWAVQERFDESGFTRAFVEHTRKTAASSRQPWTRELEEAVRGLAPARWRDVQAILSLAESGPN